MPDTTPTHSIPLNILAEAVEAMDQAMYLLCRHPEHEATTARLARARGALGYHVDFIQCYTPVGVRQEVVA